MTRRHQDRALAIIQVLEGEAALHPERSVPQASRRVDGLLELEDASDGWGPLRAVVARRWVLVEHFSRPPSLVAATRAVAKLGWLVDEWWRAPGRSRLAPPEARPPMLLMLSNGHPRSLLSRAKELTSVVMVPGIVGFHRPAFGDVILCDLRGLPANLPGTSVLRLMPTPRSDEEAAERVSALLSDSAVVPSTKDRLVEALMDHSIPTAEGERKTITRRLIEQGIAQGIEQGVEKGRRLSLLRLAERWGGPEAAEELASIEDLEELEERVLALLDVPRPGAPQQES